MSKTTILLSALCVALVLYIVLRESNAKKNALGQQSEKPKSVTVRPKTVRPKTSTPLGHGQKLGFNFSNIIQATQAAVADTGSTSAAVNNVFSASNSVDAMPSVPTGPNLKGSCSS